MPAPAAERVSRGAASHHPAAVLRLAAARLTVLGGLSGPSHATRAQRAPWTVGLAVVRRGSGWPRRRRSTAVFSARPALKANQAATLIAGPGLLGPTRTVGNECHEARGLPPPGRACWCWPGDPVAAVHLIDELDQEVAALRGIVAGVLQTGVAEGFPILPLSWRRSELGEMFKQIAQDQSLPAVDVLDVLFIDGESLTRPFDRRGDRAWAGWTVATREGTHGRTRGGADVRGGAPPGPRRWPRTRTAVETRRARSSGRRPAWSSIFIAGSSSGYSTVVLGLIIFSIRGNG